jgi:hypothetical protein
LALEATKGAFISVTWQGAIERLLEPAPPKAGKSVPKDASLRDFLLKVFNRIAAGNPNFFPIACETTLPGVEWLGKDSAPTRGALTRQALFDLATKSEWHLFKQGPPGVKPVRVSKLTPDEFLTRLEKPMEAHLLSMPLGTRYLVTTNPNCEVCIHVLVVFDDFDKFS